jgi:hypothetical protein
VIDTYKGFARERLAGSTNARRDPYLQSFAEAHARMQKEPKPRITPLPIRRAIRGFLAIVGCGGLSQHCGALHRHDQSHIPASFITTGRAG